MKYTKKEFIEAFFITNQYFYNLVKQKKIILDENKLIDTKNQYNLKYINNRIKTIKKDYIKNTQQISIDGIFDISLEDNTFNDSKRNIKDNHEQKSDNNKNIGKTNTNDAFISLEKKNNLEKKLLREIENKPASLSKEIDSLKEMIVQSAVAKAKESIDFSQDGAMDVNTLKSLSMIYQMLTKSDYTIITSQIKRHKNYINIQNQLATYIKNHPDRADVVVDIIEIIKNAF